MADFLFGFQRCTGSSMPWYVPIASNAVIADAPRRTGMASKSVDHLQHTNTGQCHK